MAMEIEERWRRKREQRKTCGGERERERNVHLFFGFRNIYGMS